jgi:hypothetical protein
VLVSAKTKSKFGGGAEEVGFIMQGADTSS